MLWIMCTSLFLVILLIVDSWNKLVEREGYSENSKSSGDYCTNRYNCFWYGSYR